MDKEEITHLETMISLHKKNLYILEEMLATYGADQPLHLINSVTMEREAIARYSKQIEGLTATAKEIEKSNCAGKPAKTTLFCRQGGGNKDHFAVFAAKQQNFYHRY